MRAMPVENPDKSKLIFFVLSAALTKNVLLSTSDLFVRVSVVARPTRVSVAVGRVIVPVLVIAENTGAVENVFAPANV